jgi:hypothetical protein
MAHIEESPHRSNPCVVEDGQSIPDFQKKAIAKSTCRNWAFVAAGSLLHPVEPHWKGVRFRLFFSIAQDVRSRN